MCYVYILRSFINNRFYIGSTNNIQRRLSEHNAGKSNYTKFTKPFELVYYQKYPDIKMAKKIESKLKKMKSKKIIERIVRDKIIISSC